MQRQKLESRKCIFCNNLFIPKRINMIHCSRPCLLKRFQKIKLQRNKERGVLTGRDLNREKVRIRDKHRCQDCNKKWVVGTRRFDIHHLNGLCGKKSKKYDKEKDFVNLITLCHKCHFNHHQFSQNLTKKKSTSQIK